MRKVTIKTRPPVVRAIDLDPAMWICLWAALTGFVGLSAALAFRFWLLLHPLVAGEIESVEVSDG